MQYDQTDSRRRRWPILVPFGLVAGLAVIWSGLWFYAASAADKAIAAWREQEAGAGRVYDCENQTIGGYPFRIEVRCSGIAVQLHNLPAPMALRAKDAVFAWQIYRPTLVIAEVSGPLAIGESGKPASYVANWTLAQASVSATPSNLERVSIVVDSPTVAQTGAADSPLFRAARGELHGRMIEGSVTSNPVIELGLRLNSASAPGSHPLLAEPLDSEAAGTLRGLADLKPKPWLDLLRELQARGGRLEVSKARVQQGDVIAAGAGTLGLTARGAIDGQMQVTVVGIEKVLKALDIDRFLAEPNISSKIDRLDRIMPGLGDIARRNAPGIVAGLGALGPRTTLDGKPAVTVPLQFADGAVLLGPVPVGRIPPLF